MLVIDKSEGLRKATCAQLQLWGFSPLPLASVDEAVQHQRQWLYQDSPIKPIALVSSKELNSANTIRHMANVIIMKGLGPVNDEYPTLKKPVNSQLLYNALQTVQSAAYQNPTTKPQLIAAQDSKHSELILIAEDNRMNQIVITKFLEGFGYSNIAIVDNGLRAVDAVKQHKFDIVLMDCMV